MEAFSYHCTTHGLLEKRTLVRKCLHCKSLDLKHSKAELNQLQRLRRMVIIWSRVTPLICRNEPRPSGTFRYFHGSSESISKEKAEFPARKMFLKGDNRLTATSFYNNFPPSRGNMFDDRHETSSVDRIYKYLLILRLKILFTSWTDKNHHCFHPANFYQ